MKKVAILGTGVQGSIMAKRLNDEKNVSELICGDYNIAAAEKLADQLNKATAVKVDAGNINNILDVVKSADLLINALPPDYNFNLMEAALQGKMAYQDLASDQVDGSLITGINKQLDMDDRFKEAGLTALMHTGTAPGLMSVLARYSANKLDELDTIDLIIYDGMWTNMFVPFWWSPETAFDDMATEPVIVRDGELIRVPPFNGSEMLQFRGIEGKRRVCDHHHEEPITYFRFFEGLKNCRVRYGGPGMELAENFYKMGLLGRDEIEVNGRKVVPIELIWHLAPPAPSDPEEIRKIIDAGILQEEAAYVVRVEGTKGGKHIRIDNYINGPGLEESFEKTKLSHESYSTGQLAFAFSKLIVDDVVTKKGVFTPEVLDTNAIDLYLKIIAELGITVDEIAESTI
ncbi:MAG: saccharopine dehydrogenase NADP-binding domain-containing protein [Desulfobacterales bacterium]|nr:saccharopine dehydrogenase NADP-binding domain-containing protein [Desulfobacterales bacterium]